jgi:futalosine hydrolase
VILLCAATAMELAACPEWSGVTRLVSGVGMPATFAQLPLPLPDGTPPRLLVNIGIAGAYQETGLDIGDIVLADGEVFGDVGFELPDPPGFRHVAEADFGREFYGEPLPTIRPAAFLRDRAKLARGCTVNACTGTEATGILRRDRFGAGFETMEGAAVAQVGKMHGVPVCEIRAISNIAARRDMRPENIRRALDSLRKYLETCDPVTAVESLYADDRRTASDA